MKNVITYKDFSGVQTMEWHSVKPMSKADAVRVIRSRGWHVEEVISVVSIAE